MRTSRPALRRVRDRARSGATRLDGWPSKAGDSTICGYFGDLHILQRFALFSPVSPHQKTSLLIYFCSVPKVRLKLKPLVLEVQDNVLRTVTLSQCPLKERRSAREARVTGEARNATILTSFTFETEDSNRRPERTIRNGTLVVAGESWQCSRSSDRLLQV